MGWSATDRRTRLAADWSRVVVLAALASLTVASCDVGTPGGVSGLGGPSATGPAPRACSELKASDLTWNIDGFQARPRVSIGVLNPQWRTVELLRVK